jgi:NAD+ kinase
MRIGIYARSLNENTLPFSNQFLDFLKSLEIECLVYRKLRDSLNADHPFAQLESFSRDEIDRFNMDYLIGIGGDGTILDTLQVVRKTGIPVLGINAGRLGFLANTSINDYKATIQELVNKSHSIEQRTVLQMESDADLFDGFNYALNDFVLHKRDSSSMITVHSYLNGQFLNSYWSDGLITATPTGSSGYSLSCGGPLLFPGSGGFVITPIAPHNLNVRPVVISDDNVLSFEVEGRSDQHLLTLDSRSVPVPDKLRLGVRKADFTFNLVKLADQNYMDTLRRKLNWGADNRN